MLEKAAETTHQSQLRHSGWIILPFTARGSLYSTIFGLSVSLLCLHLAQIPDGKDNLGDEQYLDT